MSAYLNQSHEKIVNTLKLLRYFIRFRESGCVRANHPFSQFHEMMTQQEAARLLWELIHVAINRKAGIQDSTDAEQMEAVWEYRDQQRLLDIAHRIRVYQFETAECRRRFGSLLSSPED